MGQEERRLIFTDDESEKESETIISTVGKRIRRCIGCVRCLTETPGRCVLKDAFPEMSDRMMEADVLEIHSEAFEGGFSPMVTKAMERLSNELQAFTDLGGAVPRDKGEVRLRRIEIIMRGVPEDRESFEYDTRKSVLVGPVEDVSFRYVEDARAEAPNRGWPPGTMPASSRDRTERTASHETYKYKLHFAPLCPGKRC